MGADTSTDRRRAYSRRTFLAGVGATAGVAVGVGPATAAQASPTGTGASNQRRRGVVEYYAEFGGEEEHYTNQYLLITDETSEQAPDAVANCDVADWSAEQTAPYEVSILQQLDQETEMIKGTDFYANSSGSAFEIGSTWGIADATRCGDFLALTIVPVDPDEEGLDLANVTEESGGIEATETETETTETETTETETTETGTPGFGVGAALAGVAGGAAAYLRRD